MNKFVCVILLSLFYSCQGISPFAGFGYNPNSFSNDNKEFNPLFNSYKGSPKFGYVPSPSPSRVKLDGPFDVTAYIVQSCPKKIPLEPRLVVDAEKCLEGYLSDEMLSQSLIMLASRQYQQFGSMACKVWPNVSTCLTELITYLEACQEKEYIGKVTDGILKYLCTAPKGAPEGTNNLGDFLMAGGLTCVDINGFARCMKDSKEEQGKQANFCVTLQRLRDCGKPAFSRCYSPKPWGIISSGLEDLQDQFSCGALTDASETDKIEESNANVDQSPSANPIPIPIETKSE